MKVVKTQFYTKLDIRPTSLILIDNAIKIKLCETNVKYTLCNVMVQSLTPIISITLLTEGLSFLFVLTVNTNEKSECRMR